MCSLYVFVVPNVHAHRRAAAVVNRDAMLPASEWGVLLGGAIDERLNRAR